MKLTSAILLISSALATVGAVASGSASSFQVFENFREPKNIAFSAMMGGSSHNVWVLSIINELTVNRGHKSYYITRDDQTRFAKNYPSIETVAIGPRYQFAAKQTEVIKKMREEPLECFVTMISSLGEESERDFKGLVEQFKEKKIDVAICDHFNSICVEAAISLNIPFIVSSSMALSPDAAAPYINNGIASMEEPTTINMSLWERFNAKFVQPAKFIYKLRHYGKKRAALLKSLGIENPVNAPEERWENALKIVNTAFGFDSARPLGPLVEFVGPIVPSIAPDLTPELQEFLETHKKVAYIAFGQHAIASLHDVELLMTSLLEAYESHDLDGIIWGTRGIDDIFPDYLTTRSNTTYNVQSFFENNNKKDIKFINWAPQVALLHHPSTSMFITHGGAGSLHESLNAGVRVVVFPFFGDQPGAAYMAEKNGVGLKLDYRITQQEANNIVRRVARDEGHFFQINANRFKALVQLNNKIGVDKAANLVEEVLFTHQDGQLLHRRDVKKDMSFLKATNLDLYAAMATGLVAGVFILVQSTRKVIKVVRLNQKIKTI